MGGVCVRGGEGELGSCWAEGSVGVDAHISLVAEAGSEAAAPSQVFRAQTHFLMEATRLVQLFLSFPLSCWRVEPV